MEESVSDWVAEGMVALRGGDAATARRAFERARADSPGDGDVLEGLARVAYLELDFAAAIDGWKHAYTAHRAAGDHMGAVRVARVLSFLHGAILGDWAVASGWLARAQTLLADAVDCVEAGWISLNSGMFEDDRTRKDERFRFALDVARRHGDTELELVTLAYLGASYVHGDRVREGMQLLDEALAGVEGSEVDNFQVLEEIFCQLFSACERAHDVARADQWIRIGGEIAARRNLPAVSAFCHTHYGGVLTVAGRWTEADSALTEAIRLWGLGYRSLRAGALVRLAELRVRQGRLEEAEQLLDGLAVDVDTARPLAALHLARGELALARDVLERALADTETDSVAAAPLLALLIDVDVEAGAYDDAAAALELLERGIARHDSHYLRAVGALARGRVAQATGASDSRAPLREALKEFARAQMPMELARTRLELAGALMADRPEVAIAEARAALEASERLPAARLADAAAALLRSLGERTPSTARSVGVLTKREADVLVLLGHGLSNPEISDRLYISRKTVEHHVGNILAKLGLRSRAEVAAYAARTQPARE